MDLKSITDLVDQTPFEPFFIELDNGRRIPVRHPEDLFFLPSRVQLRHIYAFDKQTDEGAYFMPSAVSALIRFGPEEGYPAA